MSVLEKIQSAAPTLTPSERKLVESLIESPQQAALGTANDFAREVGVHEATASRLARKLGFDSYASFRRALQAEFLPTQEAALRIDNTIRAGRSDPLALLVNQETAALAAIRGHVKAQEVDDTARELMQAGRLFVFAQGNAEMLALMMVKRFRRFGCDVTQLSPDPRTLAEQVLGLRAGDVVLAFAFRRAPKAYAALIETAAEAGARTVAITGTIGPMLSPAPDRLIAVPRAGGHESFQSLTVPMTVCNAIVLAAAAIGRDTAMRRLERLGALLQRFG